MKIRVESEVPDDFCWKVKKHDQQMTYCCGILNEFVLELIKNGTHCRCQQCIEAEVKEGENGR